MNAGSHTAAPQHHQRAHDQRKAFAISVVLHAVLLPAFLLLGVHSTGSTTLVSGPAAASAPELVIDPAMAFTGMLGNTVEREEDITAEPTVRGSSEQVEQSVPRSPVLQRAWVPVDPPSASAPSPTTDGAGWGLTTPNAPVTNDELVRITGFRIRERPVILERPHAAGHVVVDIWVDPQGHVLRAVQNTSLSTTLDHELVRLAEDASLRCTFEPNMELTLPMKGVITFRFELE